jgi:hypothetical protein
MRTRDCHRDAAVTSVISALSLSVMILSSEEQPRLGAKETLSLRLRPFALLTH